MNWSAPTESALYIRTFPAGSGMPSPASSEFSNSSSTRTSPLLWWSNSSTFSTPTSVLGKKVSCLISLSATVAGVDSL